jgi:hypothetical protein
MLYRGDDPIQDRSTKNRPVFGLGSSFGEPHVDVILAFGQKCFALRNLGMNIEAIV